VDSGEIIDSPKVMQSSLDKVFSFKQATKNGYKLT